MNSNVVTITFQNQKARFTVHMKEQSAVDMINATPFLARTVELAGENVCLADEIYKALGISPSETSGPLIFVESFAYWDSLQDPDKVVVWGNTTADDPSKVFDHAVPYKDVPAEIKRMFYNQYVHNATNPN